MIRIECGKPSFSPASHPTRPLSASSREVSKDSTFDSHLPWSYSLFSQKKTQGARGHATSPCCRTQRFRAAAVAVVAAVPRCRVGHPLAWTGPGGRCPLHTSRTNLCRPLSRCGGAVGLDDGHTGEPAKGLGAAVGTGRGARCTASKCWLDWAVEEPPPASIALGFRSGPHLAGEDERR